MSELRRDPITGRWVIVNTASPKQPQEYEPDIYNHKPATCALCPGNEGMTAPEIIAFSSSARSPNSPGWSLRVVPNKFPALRVEGALDKVGLGAFDMMNGVGAHEVIVETPHHNNEIPDRAEWEIQDMLWAYRDRVLDLRKDTRFKYALIFKNSGRAAGDYFLHPHSQLISLPFAPKRVSEELDGAHTYFEYKERCVYCDMIQQEIREGLFTVAENKNFLSFCPFSARFPYETWILPKQHESDFGQIYLEQVRDLSSILKQTLFKMKALLKGPAYNYVIHTSPFDGTALPDYHWHIEIILRISKIAGFEWGTGFYINPTPPELAAKTLREAR